MDTFFTSLGFGLFILMLPVLYRVVAGPTAIDRIVGVNLVGTKATVLLVLIGIIYHRVDMFVDFALTYSLLNFVASLAAARYFQRIRSGTPSTPASSSGDPA